jgi:rSAM/selenodomain-associated transferase 2
MISVVIPTLDAEQGLAATLTALVPAAVDGLVREVIVSDGGSLDRTLQIADRAGVEIVRAPNGRGTQLHLGAASARFPWLLFLHADTQLEAGWEIEATSFIDKVTSGRLPQSAAFFRFALDDLGFAPRLIECAVTLRSMAFRLPYGDQGLLISRALYDSIGRHARAPIMEDVDIVRRLGRGRLVPLRARALTSAARYRSDGYARRVIRNQTCLALYYCGVPPERIARIYGPPLAAETKPGTEST